MREWFQLPTAPALRIRAQDALEAVATAKPAGYDVIVRDVFSGDKTPHSFTTIEFANQILAALKPGGIYLANCADKGSLIAAHCELKNLNFVFVHAAAIGEIGVLSGKRYGNVVLAASSSDTNPFENPALHRVLRSLPTPAKIITGSELTGFIK